MSTELPSPPVHEHSRKAIFAALLANIGIAAAKFLGFAVTRASSLLAEGVHSVADAGNQALLLLGGRLSRREATASHQFGYGRERFFWAFVVSIVLFLLGSAFAIYEGVEKLAHPNKLDAVGVGIAILVVGLVLEGFSLRTAAREASRLRKDDTWWGFIRHSRNPELPVVLLEDFGALIGLVLALLGVGLTALTGAPVWDALGTIAIGLLLGAIAVVLAVEMKSLLIGEAAHPRVEVDIRRTLESADHVERIIHMKTQHLGPDELLVAAKIEFDAGLSFPALAGAINAAERRVRDCVPSARVIYIEPDVFEPAGT